LSSSLVFSTGSRRFPFPADDVWGALVGMAAIVGTLVVSVGGAIVLWGMRDQFSAMASGQVGQANGYSPLGTSLIIGTLITTLIPTFLIAMGIVTSQNRRTTPIGTGVAFFLFCLVFGSIWQQRGLSEVDHSGSVGVPLLIGMVGGVGIGLILAWVMRRLPGPADFEPGLPSTGSNTATDAVARRRIPLTWAGRTRYHRGVLANGLVAVLALVGGSVPVVVHGVWPLFVVNATLTLVVLALVLASPLEVEINPEGVVVHRGEDTWVELPLCEVERADVVPLDPQVDFGGWGLRHAADGREGITTAPGPALRIERAGARPLCITLTNPDTAAETLNGLVERGMDPWRDL